MIYCLNLKECDFKIMTTRDSGHECRKESVYFYKYREIEVFGRCAEHPENSITHNQVFNIEELTYEEALVWEAMNS
jgi:hypothetical protein